MGVMRWHRFVRTGIREGKSKKRMDESISLLYFMSRRPFVRTFPSTGARSYGNRWISFLITLYVHRFPDDLKREVLPWRASRRANDPISYPSFLYSLARVARRFTALHSSLSVGTFLASTSYVAWLARRNESSTGHVGSRRKQSFHRSGGTSLRAAATFIHSWDTT